MLVEIKAFVGPPVNYISLDTGKHCERLDDYFSIHWPSPMRNPQNVTRQALHIPAPPLAFVHALVLRQSRRSFGS